MSKRSLDIERLQIRLKGVSAQSARAAVDGLGHELLGRLSAPQNFTGARRAGKIDRIDSGTFQLASGTGPAELRSAIADQVAGSIKSKVGRGRE